MSVRSGMYVDIFTAVYSSFEIFCHVRGFLALVFFAMDITDLHNEGVFNDASKTFSGHVEFCLRIDCLDVNGVESN